jgi:chromosome segregation ATPase
MGIVQDTGRSQECTDPGLAICSQHEKILSTNVEKGLFEHIGNLSTILSETESELQDKRDAIKAVRDQLATRNNKIQDLEHEKVSEPRGIPIIGCNNSMF